MSKEYSQSVYSLSKTEKCGWCENFLWFNYRSNFYCSTCRIFNDEIGEVTICLNCGHVLQEDEVPIILFANPEKLFCKECFLFLVECEFIKFK